ncbi:hypothetical protein NE237_021211 [Protea cynaroides]|uniref:Dof-type domain-containing protein n=1 Tax=Protea cynaroides TaxID=273540 RepID=A0A9Q0H9U8_9MAGN|nr:hypothetical protein NE237_021211 [Protea cynaroides]
MQDFRAMGSGGGTAGGRIFAGDRRIRPHPNLALKCPRCDSLNTKLPFLQKLSNRSKSKSPKERKSTTSHSSSESSSLTTTTNEAASVPSKSSSAVAAATTAGLVNFPDSTLFVPQNPNLNTNLEPPKLDNIEQASDGGIFLETGSFTNLMTASNSAFLGFSFNDILPFRSMAEELKMPELTAGFMDQTVPIDLTEMQGRISNVGGGRGLTGLEWGTGGDQGLYDLGSSVNQSYWSTQNQWTDNSHPLYLP